MFEQASTTKPQAVNMRHTAEHRADHQSSRTADGRTRSQQFRALQDQADRTSRDYPIQRVVDSYTDFEKGSEGSREEVRPVDEALKAYHDYTGARAGRVVQLGLLIRACFLFSNRHKQSPHIAPVNRVHQQALALRGTLRQQIFVEYQTNAVAEATRLSGNPELAELLEIFARERKSAARDQDAEHAKQFGNPRERDSLKRYEKEMEKDTTLAKKLGALEHSGATPLLRNNGKDVYPGELQRVETRMQGLQTTPHKDFVHESNKKSQTYQILMPSSDGQTRHGLTGTTLRQPEGDLPFSATLAHTSPSLIPELLSRAEELHKQLVALPKSEDQNKKRIVLLGQITWYLTNAMPYQRGSASIAEWYNMTMISRLGIQIGPRGGSIDLPAFRTPFEDYAANYENIWLGNA